MSKDFHFRVYDEDTQNYLAAKSNLSEFVRELIDDYRTGKLTRSDISDIESEMMQEKLKAIKNKNTLHDLQSRKLDAETQIKERELTYHKNFNSNPSRQANSAMRKGIEQRELTDEEYENVNLYITVKKVPAGLYPDWEGKCDFCKESEIYSSIKELKDDMVHHLTTEHAKKVMVF